MALVPNLRGAEAALQAGVHKVTLPVSASAAHSLANVRKTPEAMVEEVRAVVQLRNDTAPHVLMEVGISTAFGCTLQGAVPEDDVIRLAVLCAEAGVDEVGLSDTTGMANPAQVRRLFTRLRAELGPKAGAAHMHNTRGLGLANCLAAYDVGVRTFDARWAAWAAAPTRPGLGQCGHRRPGLHVRSHGRRHRRGPEQPADGRARAAAWRACPASPCTA
jgi:hydroxymethylglutaryl-CoA lyase